MTQSPLRNILRYVVAYLAWALVAAAGFWLLFQIRANLLDILIALLEDPDTRRDTWVARAIDRWFIVVAGSIWVFCVALLEGYFRNSVERNQMARRIGRTSAILAAITAVSFLLRAIF